jgi:hypothetical protein
LTSDKNVLKKEGEKKNTELEISVTEAQFMWDVKVDVIVILRSETGILLR